MGRMGYVYRGTSGTESGAILVLHGSYGVASDMFNVGFEPLADSRGFLVVYPEMATPASPNWGYNDDKAYFARVARRLRNGFNIPADKIFICGHSAGGTMVTFLQNEMDEFAGAGVVSAAVGGLDYWDMSRTGHRTMVVWNHADPVLTEYAPNKSEPLYYNLTIDSLRRGASSVPDSRQDLPLSDTVVQAELRTFAQDGSVPELQVISWTSEPGRHTWPRTRWTGSVDAAEQLVSFFLGPVA